MTRAPDPVSAARLGRALILLGTAAFGAGLLAVPLLHTSVLLWLSVAGAGSFVLGMVLMLIGLLARN